MVGGVVGLAALAGIVFFCLRRRRGSRRQPVPQDSETEMVAPAQGNHPQSGSELGGGEVIPPSYDTKYKKHLPPGGGAHPQEMEADNRYELGG